ncbi:alpha/beta hydrolase family protein [Solirubrum puertoriconensis]|uniref:Alpha/beta hydrolase n=1 Tax=Solirubrum puertoriconensis TaxID=1751427 RepID=A0A9X0HKV2_SOLP1|nr:alpha/beta fold hydrolase [Solirubrum puertoriconensis]KUG07772.1 alpha/beta hydrolase [Solirubrum puertoriconensis]
MSYSVGYRALEVADPELDLGFPVVVLYPTTTPATTETFGFYKLEVAREAPVAAGTFPLVLISHGTGSSPWVYRTLAYYLAQHGFVVGLPEHPFNNRDNNTWANTPQNLVARPRHLQLAIDALFAQPAIVASLKAEGVGIIGHSLGGYTALALAGGSPASLPHDTPGGQAQPFDTVIDERVKAIVLLAPATPWLMGEGALRNVHVPMLMYSGEKDEHTPIGHAYIVLRGVPEPSRIEHQVVPNAGHYSFLSPFPAARVSPAFPPSQDPPGFNRARFHEQLNAEVLAFFRRTL